MLLVNLLKDIKEINQLNLKEFNPLIKGISFNSKKIKKNFIFVAIKGKRYDGHQFVNEAINKGAILIIIDNKKPIKILIKKKINFIFCKNSRILLSKISSNFFPKQPSFISAVTGTNGKTSVSHITKEIWKNCNISSAAIGTIGLITDRYKKKLPLTTIDSIQLHQILTSLYKKKINHLCIEASSHGLEQNRIDNIKINTAAFTNFSHDHLDYHKNFKLYFKSKMRLFKDLLIRNGNAIINSDIPESKTIQKLCKKYNKKVISYGFKSKYLQLLDYKSEKDYQKVYFKYKKTKFNFTLPLFGDFQIYNALCSIGIILSSGIGIKECIKSIKKINQIPGRLEKINIPKKLKNNNISIFIDYAHTPDALAKVLKTLKKMTSNKLSIVFGCGGNRDLEKRPLMGKIAKKIADKIYITDDNPRNESPKKIRSDILKTCSGAIEIASRYKAIKEAIKKCEFGEILLIAGKGHEDYQIFSRKTIKFSDKETILKILKNKSFC